LDLLDGPVLGPPVVEAAEVDAEVLVAVLLQDAVGDGRANAGAAGQHHVLNEALTALILALAKCNGQKNMS